MIKLDLHVHSQYSEDAMGTPKEIINALKKKGICGAAITDHNTIRGGLASLQVAPKDFIIIPGTEISTSEGHILGLNVSNDIKKRLPLEDTVEAIIDSGGIPVVPHLFRMMSGIKEPKLKQLHGKIPAIEVFNGCSVPKSNLKSANIAKKYNLGGTGGSDSHQPEYVGLAYTIFDSTDLSLDSLITEIKNKRTWGEGKTMPLRYRQDRMVKSIKQFFQRGMRRI
ncbi:MAG: PHP domain-containing protein [Candidatus Thermoplasmatota archaeon]|nr:PHP domain-containing protein [Candidatus Thermoplasmatota archaeon]